MVFSNTIALLFARKNGKHYEMNFILIILIRFIDKNKSTCEHNYYDYLYSTKVQVEKIEQT